MYFHEIHLLLPVPAVYTVTENIEPVIKDAVRAIFEDNGWPIETLWSVNLVDVFVIGMDSKESADNDDEDDKKKKISYGVQISYCSLLSHFALGRTRAQEMAAAVAICLPQKLQKLGLR